MVLLNKFASLICKVKKKDIELVCIIYRNSEGSLRINKDMRKI